MSKSRSRGRPRAYEPDKALTAALTEFKKRGYSSTSLDNLTEATGMNRSSLSAAFGKKQDIYRKAIDVFRKEQVHEQNAVLFSDQPLVPCLLAYFEMVIKSYTVDASAAPGCPVLCVIAGEAVTNKDMATELTATVDGLDRLFKKRLLAAQDKEELPQQADLQASAKLLGGLQHSLAIRARSGSSKEELTEFANASIRMLFGG